MLLETGSGQGLDEWPLRCVHQSLVSGAVPENVVPKRWNRRTAALLTPGSIELCSAQVKLQFSALLLSDSERATNPHALDTCAAHRFTLPSV